MSDPYQVAGGNACQCGKPIQDTANLCAGCGDDLRDRLDRIADRWAELEDALTWREVLPGVRGGSSKHGMVTVGTSINEQAVRARRRATDAVWFAVQVIRDDLDTLERPFAPPVIGDLTQDQTPAVAHWIASWQIPHITHVTSRESAEEILRDVTSAERATYRATHPTGAHWEAVNLVCDQWTTDDTGSRVPCPGDMWAWVGEGMPDLICDHDESHRITPAEWERSGWKRRLRGPIDQSGMARLAERIRRP